MIIVKRLSISLFAAAVGALSVTNALAVPIDPNISISGSASFDTANSVAPTGNATQGGTLTSIIGGTTTTTTISGTTVSGANPRSGTLTDLGDGFGIAFSGSGSYNGSASTIGPLYGDYAFTLSNTSLTDTYTVKLKFDFNGNADASGTPGSDVFGRTIVDIQDATVPATPVNKTTSGSVTSDAKNGNRVSGTPTGTFGGPVSDAGSQIITFTLLPSSSIILGGTNAEIFLDGGAFEAGTAFSAGITTLLTVDSVVNESASPIPEPGAVALLGIGLLVMALTRRRSVSASA